MHQVVREMILKGEVPFWARYAAQDYDGEWFWYALRPQPNFSARQWMPNIQDKCYERILSTNQKHPAWHLSLVKLSSFDKWRL